MKVLFVCTANSCRSQMAEAWARRLFPADWHAQSAGLVTYPIGERTRAIMAEAGLDLSDHRSKSIDEVDLDAFDLVVTLSRDAGRYLPALRDPQRHWQRPLADPMAVVGTAEEVQSAYLKARAQAQAIVREVITALTAGRSHPRFSSRRDDINK